MRETKIVLIRDSLRGKTLGMFDILADGGPVDIEVLFENVSGRDSTSRREMRKYLGRYSARLNLHLAPQSLQVRYNGETTYILGRRSGRGDAEIIDGAAQIKAVAEGIVPGSPAGLWARRMLAEICAIPAQTVDGAVARDELRLLPEFQFPLDQARLQRAAVRDVGVFW